MVHAVLVNKNTETRLEIHGKHYLTTFETLYVLLLVEKVKQSGSVFYFSIVLVMWRVFFFFLVNSNVEVVIKQFHIKFIKLGYVFTENLTTRQQCTSEFEKRENG